jgi:hypothetical protein
MRIGVTLLQKGTVLYARAALTNPLNLRYSEGCGGQRDRRRPVAEELVMKRFEVGARVVEPTYGLGSVVAVEDAYTRVQFDEHGVKKFLTSMSRLEPSDEPVPAGLRSGKPRKKRAPKKAAAAAPVGEE